MVIVYDTSSKAHFDNKSADIRRHVGLADDTTPDLCTLLERADKGVFPGDEFYDADLYPDENLGPMPME